jgi:hypothetical protein
MEFNQVIIKKEYYFFESFIENNIKDNDFILSIKKQKLYIINIINYII